LVLTEQIAVCTVFTGMKKLHSFKGNKSNLPSKPCVLCEREMVWRKSWAKNWHEVLYCSAACQLKAKLGKRAALAHSLNHTKA
jgi:hypothetical protein